MKINNLKIEQQKNISQSKKNIIDGIDIIRKSKIFGWLLDYDYYLEIVKKDKIGKNIKSYVAAFNRNHVRYGIRWDYKIYLNENYMLSPKEWAFVIVHSYLHLVFGHFDLDKVPGYIKVDENGENIKIASFNQSIWNKACDIYVNKFLEDIKFGDKLINTFNDFSYNGSFVDEISIYNYLIEHKADSKQSFGVADEDHLDMLGLDVPIKYDKNFTNILAEHFVYHIANSVSEVIADISDNSYKEKDSKFDMKTTWGKAAAWFLNKYPLLGGLATSFKIVDDKKIANMYDISVAAIDVDKQEIIINPVAYNDNIEYWKFVLAHEYLHAGLCHNERCQGRNQFLWNVACDYVINSWLKEMKIGEMPQDGLLYDEKLKNMSAEEIYDELVKNLKKNLDLKTFRGIGNGDMISTGSPSFGKGHGKGVSLDDFCRNALMEGLEYHLSKGRGFLPAGLIEEIRALAMPPIPWDIELAKWFDMHFVPVEKHRTYARPSRRQSSTPDIPRPSYAPFDFNDKSRTFGVIVDTSSSMTSREIGMALGSIASFASAKDVYAARVVFCDANAYEAGYMTPDDITGRVKVTGRGGTVLQPAVDLLENAKDFPKDGPILIITDGEIEDRMSIKRDHAFLLPRGSHLPFKPKGEVFYFQER